MGKDNKKNAFEKEIYEKVLSLSARKEFDYLAAAKLSNLPWHEAASKADMNEIDNVMENIFDGTDEDESMIFVRYSVRGDKLCDMILMDTAEQGVNQIKGMQFKFSMYKV